MTGGENTAEGKVVGKHPKRTLFFFAADEVEFYVAKLLIFIFLFGHVKEHESQSDPQQVRPGGSRTAGRGFSQATFSCDAHNAIKENKSWI